ncbi:2-oxoacid:acceptor oxidoreductase subunit alpha [Rhodovulum sp. BSW8]|uniref:2-oxoacid:acceptor oxidoreductase subunit alpha n=1 Tax=Rhodovulum visakhapatnamense TaxID=364297 RepID=A0ABS1RHU7_9RHOB|nr:MULTISPECIES: 2-oxoacid:acceptor oxidoreductase subunit alpha [Rhodovulum]MBL3568625.1 2-oxoacid:acceptor oxidoreductase subunit alpha [Rhodovulum visakhapatnamense]MBL3578487.1 2-oxoacid:acceptor oxidoreductase subunit alpha [Rhodovulum visakhapatnamense]OLS43813.1 2-oxoglutarate synthase subunit alpha [Rhodovulum sulfidophilum]RBO52406.1 2-oxoacid:acceptor oxidoreductase subunit alpha [Rhodovulum sp. BSW8]
MTAPSLAAAPTALTGRRNLEGNEACALGAIRAGCRFFAGYPITPSSEVAETMARELPKVGGTFIQMEDEIASMGAVIGASMGGVTAMTATSGPGFSLKQENLGYACGAEIPCVIVNVMRGGPSTGMPTRPAQGDILQARWGTHGDHAVIVLAPASVGEAYSETIRAVELSETLRVPVVVLLDEVIGHLTETVDLGAVAEAPGIARPFATGPREGFLPYAETADLVPPMPRPGDGYRSHCTGLTHGPDGFPTQNPAVAAAALTRTTDKLVLHRARIESWREQATEDADLLIVAIGISARAARQAVKDLRAEGLKVGLFRPVTLWPFPETPLREAVAAAGTRKVLVPEMNQGQLVLEVERVLAGRAEVTGLSRIDGETLTPDEIAGAAREALK